MSARQQQQQQLLLLPVRRAFKATQFINRVTESKSLLLPKDLEIEDPHLRGEFNDLISGQSFPVFATAHRRAIPQSLRVPRSIKAKPII